MDKATSTESGLPLDHNERVMHMSLCFPHRPLPSSPFRYASGIFDPLRGRGEKETFGGHPQAPVRGFTP